MEKLNFRKKDRQTSLCSSSVGLRSVKEPLLASAVCHDLPIYPHIFAVWGGFLWLIRIMLLYLKLALFTTSVNFKEVLQCRLAGNTLKKE